MMNKRIKSKTKKDMKSSKITEGFWIRFFIFCFVSLVLVSTLFIKDKIEGFANFYYNENSLSTVISEDGLKMHFIDVGQADATLIEFPTGETMLIDSGDKTQSSHSKFVSYLDTIDFKIKDGERVIDYFILTHPDSDHIGGAEYIFDNFKIERFYYPDIYSLSEDIEDIPNAVQSPSELYDKVIKKSLLENCEETCATSEYLRLPTSSNESSQEMSWLLDFYTPIVSDLPYIIGGDLQKPIANDYSPIMILTYMEIKVMFTGDASANIENSFINYYDAEEYSYIDFDVDILKVGHHGSQNSTCSNFLNFITPEYAVVSVGANNNYGHPSKNTLERLKEYGIEKHNIYRTDLNGTIIIGISQKGQMSLQAESVQYTNFKIEWWMLYLTSELILIIVLNFSYIKLYIKKNKLNKN